LIILSWKEMANADDTDLYIMFVVLCSGIALHSFLRLDGSLLSFS
jgi:hypothetical protein